MKKDVAILSDSGVAVSRTPFLRGDWNRDVVETSTDIPAMLTALSDLNAYASMNSLTPD